MNDMFIVNGAYLLQASLTTTTTTKLVNSARHMQLKLISGRRVGKHALQKQFGVHYSDTKCDKFLENNLFR